MSECRAQYSRQGHGRGSGRLVLVSCDRSGSAEASRDYFSWEFIQVEDVVCPLAAWYIVLPGVRRFMLDRRSRYAALFFNIAKH